MTNQDIDGKVPPESAAGTPAAPKGAPDTLEQQLEKEREARALMRERLRTTEALAAEAHALRARMAQELERVTADRDRLRNEAMATPTPVPPVAGPAAASRRAASRATEPPLTSPMAPPKASHADDRPLRPPVPARRRAPWGALAMLSVLALAVAAVAGYRGSLPGLEQLQAVLAPAPAPAPALTAAAPPAPRAAPAQPVAAAASVAVATAMPPSGAVALPPLAPDAQLAATPPAAGPAAAATPAGPSTTELAGRLRKALDGEGIAASVDIDASTGRVTVADPQADGAQRQRTEMVIRAVYAGASLPEPQIEHRWLSPMHGTGEATATSEGAGAAPAARPAPDTALAARRVAPPRAQGRRRSAGPSVAEAEELTPVLPAGRLTENCMAGLAGTSSTRRAALSACMKHSCCSSSANHNSEECRAYQRAYPFTCGAG